MRIWPQNLHIFKLKSIFVRILLSFIIFVFACILLVGFISYKYSSNLLIDEVVNSKLLLIKQIQSDIDKEISGLDRLTFQLSLQPKIKAALYITGDDWNDDQIVFSDAIRTISGFKMANNIILDIWVELFKSNTIINDNYKYDKDFFFENVYKYNNIDWNIVKEKHPRFISIGRQSVTIDGKEKEVILFSRGITVDSVIPEGLVCINVNVDVFNNILHNINREMPSFTYVVDFQGNVVLSNLFKDAELQGNALLEDFMETKAELNSDEGYFQRSINNKNYLVIYTTSQVSKWRYITIIPTEVITKKANKIKGIATLAAMLCLLLGIIFSYMLTTRLYYPINEMVNYINAFKIKRRIDEGKVSEDELTFINRIITYIYNENENLKNLLSQNMSVLKEKLIYDLLDGRVNSNKFAEVSQKIGMKFPFVNFQVIVFEMENYSSYSKIDANIDIKKEIFQIYEESYCDKIKIYYMRRGSDKIIILVNLDDNPESSEFIYDFIGEIKKHFMNLFGIIFTVGVGNIYNKPEKIFMSFIDALSALKYKVVKGEGSIIHVEELNNIPDNVLEYSIETEKQIINLIKAGNSEEVGLLLDEIIRKNIRQNEVSAEVVENLFNSLASTAIRAIYDIRSSVGEIFGDRPSIYKELLQKNGIEAKREYILNIFKDIIRYINSRKQTQNESIMAKVRDYVYQNYNCYELSLTQVGEAVGLSPSYLSSIFKDISGGYSFVDYVNMVRVEKSKYLLQNSDLKIFQIAERVGFCSSNNYIKVFKKHEGITPGQFRESINTKQ